MPSERVPARDGGQLYGERWTVFAFGQLLLSDFHLPLDQISPHSVLNFRLALYSICGLPSNAILNQPFHRAGRFYILRFISPTASVHKR